MPWDQVISILKLGLSGLVFLFAVLGFRLLAREQAKPVADPEVLKNIRIFNLNMLGSALLVAVFGVLPLVVHPTPDLEACQDSLDRLDTTAHDAAIEAAQLRTAIRTHVERCAAVMEGARR